MLTDGRTDGRTDDGRTTDGRTTDAGVTGILIAHLGAFGSGELKMMCNNPNLDLVNINAYTNFGQILSICSQDIEQKQNYDKPTNGRTNGRNDRQPKSYIPPPPPYFKAGL